MDLNSCELVEKLLQSTGLSCDALLLQLQAYRSTKSKTDDQENTTSNEEAKTNVSINDNSNSLISNTLSKKETKQNVSSNDISVIVETKSSKIDDNENHLESESQCSVESSSTSSSKAINQGLPHESEDVQRFQQSVTGNNKCHLECDSGNVCQKKQDESVPTYSSGRKIVFNTSICDVIIAKISAKEQKADSSKMQKEKLDDNEITKSIINRNSNQRTLKETQEKVCSTSSEDDSLEERNTENNKNTELLLGTRENCSEATPNNANVALSCQGTLENKTTEEEAITYREDECVKLSSEVSEQSNKYLEERTSSETSSEKIIVTLTCQTRPEEVSNINEDNLSKLSSKICDRKNYETSSVNNNKIMKPCTNSEENLSHASLQNQKLHSTISHCQTTSEKEIGYDLLSKTDQSTLSSEIEEQDNSETQENTSREVKKCNVDFEENSNKSLPTNIDDSRNCNLVLEKQRLEDSIPFCEANSSKLTCEVLKQNSCETQNENCNKIPKPCLDSLPNCPHTGEKETMEKISNILDEANTSLQSSSKNDFDITRETTDTMVESLCDNDHNVKNINDHDYSNPLSNTDSNPETKEASLSGFDNTRETLPLKTDDFTKSGDNLRDVLRMQLSSLRNTKKSTSLLPLHRETCAASLSNFDTERDSSLTANFPKSEDSLKDVFSSLRYTKKSTDLLTPQPETDEGSLSNFDTEQDTSPLKTDVFPKSEDNLRDVLRMQLSSLRNMKKNTGLLPTFKKTMFFQSLKKKRKSCDINPVIPTDVDDEKESSYEDGKEKKVDENKDNFSTNENSFVSSDDTEFVIVDVTGGIDRLTPNIESEGNEESMFASITNTENENKRHENFINTPCSSSQCLDTSKLDETSNTSNHNILNSAFRSKNENSPHVTVRKNISENFTRDPGINKSVKNSEKSPFVSDSLEDFLNESAELRISYAIPKLGAEEGITENTKKCLFDNVVSSQTPKMEQANTQREKPKLIKAKTLAEMRRHFEKLKATEDKQVVDAAPQYKRKKGFKRKFFNIEKGDTKRDDQSTVEPNSICNASVSMLDENAPPRNSYIIYNNKKLWVPCNAVNKCLGNVQSKTNKDIVHEKTILPPSPKPAQICNRKPSLLSCLSKNKLCAVKYKPGPMCKKAVLQNLESKAHWVTELKTLPKIYLQVVPEVRKPIDPSIVHLLPIFDEPIITEERVNFALTALKPKHTNDTQESFNFHIPFSNKQEKMVVRKPFKPDIVYKANSEDTKTDPAEEISKVISDLITYVEIKELGDTIIKEDESATDVETFNEIILKTKTRKVKRKKLDLELLRLNCKVIDVATNEEDTDCSKPYCKLGCVCKSLLCESVFSNHCQLVECMFGCTCPSDPYNNLAATNNSLSVHTVTHLEDKAKKNLARVEKEFTQTLIHTDNDAILIGTAKVRRSTKPPKKYSDFVGDDDFDSPRSVPIEKEPLNCKKFDLVLDKLLLDDVIPFCFNHNVYNCSCKGETEIVPTKKSHEIPKIRIVKTKEDQHKAWYDSCARIRTVFPEYKERNKTAVYKDKLRRGQLSYKGRRGPKKKQEVSVENKAEQTLLNSDIQSNAMTKESPKIPKIPSKRKQSFDIREDILLPHVPADTNEKEFALQRRKKKEKPNIIAVDTPAYQPIFDGEIKVSLKENKEMLNIIGNENSSLEYLRILPWRKLIHSFLTGKICIWARDKPNSPLLCNSAGYFPPKNFVTISKVAHKSEIINWIITDNLPADRPRDLMHLILTPKNMHFLIAGYCLKKINKDTTPLETQNDFLNKWPTPAPELSSAADPLQISPSSSPTNFADIDVDCEDDTHIDTTSNESENRDRINTDLNQQALLRDNTQKNVTDTSTLASPEIQISVTTKPVSSVEEDLNILKPEELKLPYRRKRPNTCTPLKPIKRKNINKSTSLTPRKGIANRQNTTKITTKRTYVKVGSMFNTLQSMANKNALNNVSTANKNDLNNVSTANKNDLNIVTTANKNDLNNVSTPTIKQILNTPPSTLNTNGISLLLDSIVRSQLSESTESDESLSTISSTLNSLLEKSANNVAEINSDEKEQSSPLRRKSELLDNTEKCEKRSSTTSSMLIEKEPTPTRDLAKTLPVSTPSSQSDYESLQTTVSNKEVVSKKCPQDPLEITEIDQSPPKKSTEEQEQVSARNKRSSPKKCPQSPLEITEIDQSPPKKSTEEQKQASARNNRSSPKKSRRDPLEITENDDLLSTQLETSTSSPKSKNEDTHLKRIKPSSDHSSVNKNRITAQSGVIPSRSLKCTHKDMNNQSKTLVLTNKIFNERKLYFTKDDVKASEITVALPPVSRTSKWRMIYLNSDFTYLTFMTVNYSIKYTDLMDVVKMSSNIKSTITLRNKEFSDTFKHPLFGIYCLPDYQDRLFIGPYVPSEKHSIETLRYLQGRLIDTQIFNKMVGRKDSEKGPVWLHEVSPRPISLPNGLIIDITEDDEAHEITVVDLDSDSEETQNTSSKSQGLENSLLFPPFVEELTPEELKSKQSINRFIMTNIPHLGYFDAYQRDSKAIEVFWPDGTKGYRFPNVTFAKNLLTRYLSQIFCPIPQDFKINVIIMTNLGVQINKPIDPKYLSRSGPYFCGEFGIYERNAIPDSLLTKHNVSSIDSLLMSHQEIQEDEHAMIRIFGLFLMSNEELRKHSEPYKILQWAISETYILKKLCENYESEKSDLQTMIRAKTQKLKEKRKEKRTEEKSDSTRMDISETIEIEDSDEEGSPKTNSEVTSPTFKKILKSGRIDTESVHDQSKSRSLLKSNVWIKPGRSLLKSNDKTGRKIASPEKPASIEPVKISLHNSNIILKKNNLLITKLK